MFPPCNIERSTPGFRRKNLKASDVLQLGSNLESQHPQVCNDLLGERKRRKRVHNPLLLQRPLVKGHVHLHKVSFPLVVWGGAPWDLSRVFIHWHESQEIHNSILLVRL